MATVRQTTAKESRLVDRLTVAVLEGFCSCSATVRQPTPSCDFFHCLTVATSREDPLPTVLFSFRSNLSISNAFSANRAYAIAEGMRSENKDQTPPQMAAARVLVNKIRREILLERRENNYRMDIREDLPRDELSHGLRGTEGSLSGTVCHCYRGKGRDLLKMTRTAFITLDRNNGMSS